MTAVSLLREPSVNGLKGRGHINLLCFNKYECQFPHVRCPLSAFHRMCLASGRPNGKFGAEAGRSVLLGHVELYPAFLLPFDMMDKTNCLSCMALWVRGRGIFTKSGVHGRGFVNSLKKASIY